MSATYLVGDNAMPILNEVKWCKPIFLTIGLSDHDLWAPYQQEP